MENNFRDNKEDILKEWLDFREDTELAYLTEEDKKHFIHFEKISKNILNSIPEKNRQFVKKQLDQLDHNFYDYIYYWCEKYYRNGFCDGMELIKGCCNSSRPF